MVLLPTLSIVMWVAKQTAIGLTMIAGVFVVKETVVEPMMNESADSSVNAAQGLPDLTDMDEEEAIKTLNEHGFTKKSNTKGGYEHWVHEDGSIIGIRPDGELTRSGPKRPQPDQPNAKHIRDRYRPDGTKILYQPGNNNHNT